MKCHYTSAQSGIDWEGWEESGVREGCGRGAGGGWGVFLLKVIIWQTERESDETNRRNCICNKRPGINGLSTTYSVLSANFINIQMDPPTP